MRSKDAHKQLARTSLSRLQIKKCFGEYNLHVKLIIIAPIKPAGLS